MWAFEVMGLYGVWVYLYGLGGLGVRGHEV